MVSRIVVTVRHTTSLCELRAYTMGVELSIRDTKVNCGSRNAGIVVASRKSRDEKVFHWRQLLVARGDGDECGAVARDLGAPNSMFN